MILTKASNAKLYYMHNLTEGSDRFGLRYAKADAELRMCWQRFDR